MEIRHFDTWRSFTDELRELREKEEKLEERGNVVLRSKFLFRGLPNDDWDLTTTLERRYPGKWTWQEYLRLVRSTAPAVETFTDHGWQFPTWSDTNKWGSEYDDQMLPVPGYDYWAYLRHHGFPSPLMDWSRSPYVAAFFALRQVDPTVERVAIHCYQEASDGSKWGSSDIPTIGVHGPYVRSHSRHMLQQCTYTTCSIFKDREWRYTKHSEVFGLNEPQQDRLWKFTLPTSERLTVLRYLDEHNLNAYSLFSTEDALLETVALRELEFRAIPVLGIPAGGSDEAAGD